MNELETFMQLMKSVVDIDDEQLTDEATDMMIKNLEESFSSVLIVQATNQIVKNLEDQGLNRDEAKESIDAIKEALKEMVYGEDTYSGNKKVLIDAILGHLSDVFDAAVEKFHMYAIELPMTIDSGAKVPTYAHDTDAAADLYALETVVVEGKTLGNKIRTGVKIQLPEGWLALILPRSSMGTKTPLRLSNSVGLIDSGYRGELGVLYDNISDTPYTINAGDRIAQLLVMPSYRFQAKVVDILSDSDRGETGFGDSGK